MTMHDAFRDLERENKAPRYFLVFFFALIAWGLCYIAAYTPEISGWSQYRILEKEREAEDKAAAAIPLHENPYETDAKAVAEGKGLYAEHCGECHGEDLRGDDGPDLTGHLSFGETDAEKYRSIAEGRPGGMPAFGSSLGRDRIWKLLSYIDSVREHGRNP